MPLGVLIEFNICIARLFTPAAKYLLKVLRAKAVSLARWQIDMFLRYAQRLMTSIVATHISHYYSQPLSRRIFCDVNKFLDGNIWSY